MSRMKFIDSNGKIFRAMKLWALGKIILLSGIFILNLLIIIISEKVNTTDISYMSFEQMVVSLGWGTLIISFIMVLIVFFISAGSIFQTYLLFQMVRDFFRYSKKKKLRLLNI